MVSCLRRAFALPTLVSCSLQITALLGQSNCTVVSIESNLNDFFTHMIENFLTLTAYLNAFIH